MFKKLKEYMNMLRVTEDIKNAQIQLLESKTTVYEMKNTLDKI